MKAVTNQILDAVTEMEKSGQTPTAIEMSESDFYDICRPVCAFIRVSDGSRRLYGMEVRFKPRFTIIAETTETVRREIR